jgi:hypothetical protein
MKFFNWVGWGFGEIVLEEKSRESAGGLWPLVPPAVWNK